MPNGGYRLDGVPRELSGLPFPIPDHAEVRARAGQWPHMPTIHGVCTFRSVGRFLWLIASGGPGHIVAERNHELRLFTGRVPNDVVRHLQGRGPLFECSHMGVGDECCREGV